MYDRLCYDCDYFQPVESMQDAVCLADDTSSVYPYILEDGKRTSVYGWCDGEMWEGEK